MYTVRTNILFSETEYQVLKALAKEHKTSIGDLVRKAVDQVYIDSIASKRQLIKDKVAKYKVIQQGQVDYKDLIEKGRKY